MTALLKILKYVGKSGIFGTEVSSIGLKRIDSVVPAVYGMPILPGDDKSDVLRFPVLVPDDGTTTDVYSFESIFKIHLKSAPDNQLTNIRIYPEGSAPETPNRPKLFIGNSLRFTRPTNGKSLVALNDIWDYSEENPFYVTIGGTFGYNEVPEEILTYEYQLTVSDSGFGNKYYVDGERSAQIDIVEGKTYILINHSPSGFPLRIYDIGHTEVVSPDIVYTSDSGLEIVTIHATHELLLAYANGFIYGSITDPDMGGIIDWTNIVLDPTTIEYVVETQPDLFMYFNGFRGPVLELQIGKTYIFTNVTGATHPFRLFSKGVGGSTEFVVLDGVTVVNGGTDNEVVTVDTNLLVAAANLPVYYGSVTQAGIGNFIRLLPRIFNGNYNMKTVGGGVNPLSAGETDYIYIQMAINKDTDPGDFIPNLIIKYDES